MDWTKLKQEYFEQCCDGFVETHYGNVYRKMKLSPAHIFDWFRNKLDTDTFCLICNEWHPEGECMRIKPVKEDSWVSTGTIDDWVMDVLEIE